jgi:hypothetical protein
MGAIVLAALAGLIATRDAVQFSARPPIGEFGSAAGAMIFYVAHGAAGACGPGYSDWTAAEATVQWDTHELAIASLAGDPIPHLIRLATPRNFTDMHRAAHRLLFS